MGFFKYQPQNMRSDSASHTSTMSKMSSVGTSLLSGRTACCWSWWLGPSAMVSLPPGLSSSVAVTLTICTVLPMVQSRKPVRPLH